MQLREPFPLRTYIGLSLLGLGSGFVGALSGATIASNTHHVATSIPVIEPAEPQAELVPIASTTTARIARAAAPSNQIGFVIEVDGSRWMILDVDPSSIEHRRARLVGGEYASDTIAALRANELTSELRGWRGQDVIVDGTCTDTLRDFAVITQVTGDPIYADDSDHPHWTATTIEANGTPVVAAKLAHCTGTYARAASAPAAVPFTEVADSDALAKQATATLLASETGQVSRTQLAEQFADVKFDQVTEISTKIARDPRTGTTWVAVHGRADFACGGPDVNLMGLYRVAEGELVAVREQLSPDLAEITALVDLDGDGVPELLGNGWLSPNRAFYNQDLAPIVKLEIPFFGCPC